MSKNFGSFPFKFIIFFVEECFARAVFFVVLLNVVVNGTEQIKSVSAVSLF